MIAIDADQDLYGRFSLKEMGIDFRGRTHALPASYRLIHEYFGVDKAILWQVATDEIPPLGPIFSEMLRTLE